MIDAIAYIATIFTTLANFPQAYRIWHKTCDLNSLDNRTYLLLLIGVSLWLFYAVNSQLTPLIVANSIALLPLIYINFKLWSR
jgi:uncharacterized protein with PQ loop repeat